MKKKREEREDSKEMEGYKKKSVHPVTSASVHFIM